MPMRRRDAVPDIREHDLMSDLDGEIRDGRHHMQVRVYYEDMDFPDWAVS